ncbi:hypothetical protein TraAM80_03156 [Trypanosoma rangeli]|uniref:Uncharacterized protein n=1 Tax=Trypanosoma rangeli TaxID=5698 RepID=A0A3R7KQL9_TRYRA|nr:uncharacterized protein TraAM80_03156 [Trypanosoma rangeli]RNF07782.1 hypothetical protein TraAM80_03156 [Trypanosoma rangeli]|eukprot:RNF07782.1 hypothetical protein TraAM80_03156 [Trypanosoma rangeli]
MEKIVRTVYRQLYKKAASVDKDIALRSVLTCSPQRVYDHRRGVWVAFDVAKQAGWPESRIFLDSLIRRLNRGCEFYIPQNGCDADGRSGSDSDRGVADGGRSGSGGNESSLSLLQVLRKSFEETPFSITQMNNAFAALKELAYVTEMASKHYGSGVLPPQEAKTLPTPNLTVVDKVEGMHNVSLTKGLSDVLERLTGDQRGIPSRTSEKDVRVKEESENVAGKDDDDDEGEEHENGAAALSGKKPNKTPFDTPNSVHMLLAHPQLYDFFRYSVMIVIRSTPNDSAACVLNKPLENDEGMPMPVNATIRLNHVHPIFGKHLANHTVMIGGPVSRGSFDSSILLLHRIPDVEDAIPISHSLWVDGNYDVLQKKLEDGTADANDIIVICGFSGWGGEQLAGEIRSGTWVVARGSTDDPAMDDFIFALARYTGAPSIAAAPQPSLSSSEIKATQMSSAGQNRNRGVAVWSWAYNALGSPYTDLARNQKPLMQGPQDK